MTDKWYGVVANVAILVAVASALLFDSAGVLRPAVAAAGALAAFVSVTSYFRFQWIQERKQTPAVEKPALPAEGQVSQLVRTPSDLGIAARKFYGGKLKSDYTFLVDSIDTVDDVSITQRNKIRAWQCKHTPSAGGVIWESHALRQVHQTRLPSSAFAEQVAEIVKRLAPTCEFELTTEGNLQIHPKHPGPPLTREFDEIDKNLGMPISRSRTKTVN